MAEDARPPEARFCDRRIHSGRRNFEAILMAITRAARSGTLPKCAPAHPAVRLQSSSNSRDWKRRPAHSRTCRSSPRSVGRRIDGRGDGKVSLAEAAVVVTIDYWNDDRESPATSGFFARLSPPNATNLLGSQIVRRIVDGPTPEWWHTSSDAVSMATAPSRKAFSNANRRTHFIEQTKMAASRAGQGIGSSKRGPQHSGRGDRPPQGVESTITQTGRVRTFESAGGQIATTNDSTRLTGRRQVRL